MSPMNEPLTEFERNARVVLEESLSRIDGRTRSRLNQARHAALEAAGARRRVWWRSLTLMPTAGVAAAALLVAVVLWHRQPSGEPPVLEAQHAAEDMDLLADSEALELLDGWDGPFYEWATAQTDNVQSEG
jgi:anti-sigma-K factor RskA